MGKWSLTPSKGWREVNVTGDDTAIQQGVHAILDVIFGDRWRVSERVVTEILRKNSFRLEYLIWSTVIDTQPIELNV
jgi:hypothetical protein